jgi:hypothetical protein
LSASGKFIYHLAIIDYLQDFNTEKRCENVLKVFKNKVILNKKDAQISAVEPGMYYDRYLRFLKEFVIIDQKKNQDLLE